MTHETYGRVSATSLLADTFSDFSDLMQKEIRLARAEVSNAVSTTIKASIGLVVAGLLGLTALSFALWGVVFLIASFGLAMHWSAFIVAAVLAIIAGGLFIYARAQMTADNLAPKRTATQVREDIRTAREQMK